MKLHELKTVLDAYFTENDEIIICTENDGLPEFKQSCGGENNCKIHIKKQSDNTDCLYSDYEVSSISEMLD